MADETKQRIKALVRRYVKARKYPCHVRSQVTNQICVVVCDVHESVGLDLDGLEAANAGYLAHDFDGIMTHWSTSKHEFQDCFVPRFIKRGVQQDIEQ